MTDIIFAIFSNTFIDLGCGIFLTDRNKTTIKIESCGSRSTKYWKRHCPNKRKFSGKARLQALWCYGNQRGKYFSLDRASIPGANDSTLYVRACRSMLPVRLLKPHSWIVLSQREILFQPQSWGGPGKGILSVKGLCSNISRAYPFNKGKFWKYF